MQNMQEQYEAAQERIRQAGVMVKENVMSCCRTCAMAEMDDVTAETLVAWTFAGQGNELVWEDDQPMYLPEDDDEDVDVDDDDGNYGSGPEESKPADSVYWYHSGGVGAAAAAAKAFKDAGFEIDWDGTENKAVLVKFA